VYTAARYVHSCCNTCASPHIARHLAQRRNICAAAVCIYSCCVYIQLLCIYTAAMCIYNFCVYVQLLCIQLLWVYTAAMGMYSCYVYVQLLCVIQLLCVCTAAVYTAAMGIYSCRNTWLVIFGRNTRCTHKYLCAYQCFARIQLLQLL